MKAIQDYYYIKENQEVAGPHSLAELKDLEAEGVIDSTTYVAREGYEQWRPFSEELAGQDSLLETGSNTPSEPARAVEEAPPTADPAAPTTLDLPFDLRPEPGTEPATPVPQSEAGGEPATYPWEPRPDLVRRADAYLAAGQATTFACKCNELLNTVNKKDSRRGGYRTKLHVCPDLITVSGQLGKLGFLRLLLQAFGLAWCAFWQFFSFVMSIFSLNPINIGFNLSALATTIAQAVAAFILAPILGWWYRLHAAAIAERIRANPKSADAIRKLFRFTALAPRYWGAGDIAQIVRVDSRSLLTGTRRLVLLVQDNPMGKKAGWLESLMPNLCARRRVFFLRLARQEADAAAQQAAAVLGLAVTEGKFSRGRLKLSL